MAGSLVTAMRRSSGLVTKALEGSGLARSLHTSGPALGSLTIPDRLSHVLEAEVRDFFLS